MKDRIGIVCFLCILCGCTSNNKGKYVLVNKASEPIEKLEVSICGQTSKFSNLSSGGAASGSYSVKGDCHFSIIGQFKSGKKISKEDGYVTNGFDYSHEIEISESQIDIKGGQAK